MTHFKMTGMTSLQQRASASGLSSVPDP